MTVKNKKKINKKRKKQPIIDEIIKRRLLIALIVIIVLFVVVFIKLYQVMIIDNNKYKKKLKVLSYNIVEGSSAPRGRILDRNGNILVDNMAVKTIYFQKSKKISLKDEIKLAYEVSSHLNLNYDKLNEEMKKEFWILIHEKEADKKIKTSEINKYKQSKLTKNDIKELKMKRITEEELNSMNDADNKAAYLYYLMNKGYAYDEKTIKTGDVTEEEYAYIAENNDKLHGFNTRLDWERVYPYGDTFRTILGKVTSATQGLPLEDKEYYLKQGYALNDRVGVSYLEKQYENYLRGTKEKFRVINRNELQLISEGKRGNDIVLTIDINLQRRVDDIVANQVRSTKGEANTYYYDHSATVIQDPRNGEILAMSAKKIVNGRIIDNTESIMTEPVTPGSIVKGASMLVGYNTGAVKIGEYKLDECIQIKGTNEKCSSRTLGTINDITALAKSSNVYQFKTALRVAGYEYRYNMGLPVVQEAFDKYRNMYHSFGLGVKTEIDLPVESLGYGAKEDKRGGNLLDFVIGQYETYTPIQLSQYISTLANSGTKYQPHLLKEVHAANNDDGLGDVIYSFGSKEMGKIDTQPEYMQRVRDGFYAVINSPGGYGIGYMDPGYSPAGKTGTSQSFIDTNNDGVIDTETITSSFIGYAPSNDPRMSIIVTSPNSSMPYTSVNYASMVTQRLSNQLTDAYFTYIG